MGAKHLAVGAITSLGCPADFGSRPPEEQAPVVNTGQCSVRWAMQHSLATASGRLGATTGGDGRLRRRADWLSRVGIRGGYAPGVAETSGERHASWGELFFDLVAVAGVAMLGHLLAGEFNLTSLGLFGILFIAFWLTWTTYMLYGNSTDNPRLARLLIGMFGLGVMAASVPGLAESILHPHEDPSTTYAAAFALAYVLTRWVGASSGAAVRS